MNNWAYSDLKVAWHTDKINDLRNTGQCVPGQVQLVISDLCNHDCPWCAYRTDGYTSNQHFPGPDGERNPNRRIPTEKCYEILDDIARMGIRAVQFTGGGEPTVHADHVAIFHKALSKGLKCSLVTNGNKLADGWKAVYPRFDWLRVSLDAGSNATYAAIRRVQPNRFSLALQNIEKLTSYGCKVGVSFIVLKENYAEAHAAATAARSVGAASIRFAALFSPEMLNYYDGWRIEAEAAVVQAGTVASDGFEVLDMFGQRLGDLGQGAVTGSFCGYQHLNVYIGADLGVYRCCNTAYNDLGFVGSLKDQTFSEFFASDAKRSAYGEFDARSCKHCAFNGKNEMLRYLVNPNPTHVDFV